MRLFESRPFRQFTWRRLVHGTAIAITLLPAWGSTVGCEAGRLVSSVTPTQSEIDAEQWRILILWMCAIIPCGNEPPPVTTSQANAFLDSELESFRRHGLGSALDEQTLQEASPKINELLWLAQESEFAKSELDPTWCEAAIHTLQEIQREIEARIASGV